MAFPSNRKASVPFSNIAGLNTLPSEYDRAIQQQQDDFNLDKELDLFTNPNFFDWNTGDNVDHTYEDPLLWQATDEPIPSGDFVPDTHNLSTLSTVPSNTEPFPSQPAPLRQKYQPALAANGPVSPTTPTSATTTTPNLKRRHDSLASTNNHSDTNDFDPKDSALDVSAEEDKRRRNTAASARFRVKKKQREQAMEKTAKEMTDKVSALEGRVVELEKENMLLKGLLTQKVVGKGSQRKASGEMVR